VILVAVTVKDCLAIDFTGGFPKPVKHSVITQISTPAIRQITVAKKILSDVIV
jgi:hypothetical protein